MNKKAPLDLVISPSKTDGWPTWVAHLLPHPLMLVPVWNFRDVGAPLIQGTLCVESARNNRNGKERASRSCFGVAESEEARSCRANLSGDV